MKDWVGMGIRASTLDSSLLSVIKDPDRVEIILMKK